MADSDRDEDPIPRSPTRATRPANSRKRRSWYGWGTLARVEKNWFGRLIDDLVTVYADVTVFSLPVLWYIGQVRSAAGFGLVAPGLAAWVAIVVAATLMRGGWIAPLGSDTLGWVSMRYFLLPLRVIYYNLTFLVAIFGGLALEVAVGLSGTAVVGACCLAVGATLVFPTVADVTYSRLLQ